MSAFLPRKRSHSLYKLHKKEQQKSTKISHRTPWIFPRFANQEAAEEDMDNKEQIASGSRKTISHAQRGSWGCPSSGGGMTPHALLSAVWLRKGGWERDRSIAE